MPVIASRFPLVPMRMRQLVPGVVAAAGAVVLATLAAQAVPALSAMVIAMVMGVMVRNLASVPRSWEPGLALSASKVLRAGVVLLGLQLSLADVVAVGPVMLATVVAVVALGIVSAEVIGRWLGISATARLLIGCGFSVCGAAAVAGAEGVIEDRKDEEVVTAVALVVVFGTVMIAVIPALASVFGLSQRVAGMWAGASIHEVAQVVAAGGVIGAQALTFAVIVKLARVLMLAPVLVAISWMRRRTVPVARGARRPPLVPVFVAGFVAMVALRSSGLVPTQAVACAAVVQRVFLAAAMFALGTSVRWSMLRAAGVRPVVLAGAVTGIVTGVGLVGALLS